METISSSPVPAPSPLLVLYGDHDQFTGIGRYNAWVKSLQEVETGKTVIADRKIEGGDHFWQGEALDRMLVGVEKWIDKVTSDYN
jgi:uncharacterized protein